jgi:hypothetical protein
LVNEKQVMLKKLITSILQSLKLIEAKEEVKQEEPIVVVEQPKVVKKKAVKKPAPKTKSKNEKKQTRSKK